MNRRPRQPQKTTKPVSVKRAVKTIPPAPATIPDKTQRLLDKALTRLAARINTHVAAVYVAGVAYAAKGSRYEKACVKRAAARLALDGAEATVRALACPDIIAAAKLHRKGEV